MLRAFRSFGNGVSTRVLGIAGLAAILFIAGCTTSGNNATQLAVATLSGGLPAGSVSVGAGAYPSTALSATGGTAPYTWVVTMGTLPTGLTLSSSGMISGTPTTAGTFPFTVTVTDAATPVHTATGSLSITINPQIAITNPGAMTDGEAGAAYPAKALSETGGAGSFSWVINSGSLPGGLTLSSAGSISGTISASVVPSTFNFTAKVTDSQGNAAVSGTISIKVDAALAITPPTLPVGVANVSYSTPAFTATGGSGSGYAFAVASGSLAPLAIGASSGIITGTPTTAGTLQFTIKVTDSLGYSVTSINLSIVINAAIGVVLSPTSPVTLDQGKTQLVTATVSNDPNNAGVSWVLTSGLGSLSGQSSTTTVTYNAPTTVTLASSAVVTATSKTDPSKSATFTINLVPPPQITTITMAAGNVNGAYSSQVSMTGGVAPYTWAIVTAPTGLTLGSSTTSTVTVQGTPTVSGNNQTFTIKVADAQGLIATSSGLTVTIYPTLVITPPALPVGVVGVSYTSPAFTATGGSGSGYIVAVASGSLAPLAIGASSGIITGTPTTAGTLNFTAKVTDSVSNMAVTSNLSITINPAITVGLAPASPVTLDQGKTQLVTASVNNDPNSAGVTWSALTGLGSLSGSTSTTITYNAPATVSSASTGTFTATSVTDTSKSATYTINLVPPPQITTTTMAAGNVNGAYSSPVSMTGGVAPYSWAIVTAPTGLTLSSSTTSAVTVQGTPTVSGNNQTFTIKVTDAQGLSATSTGLTISVYATLVLTPPSLPLPTGVQGLNYPTSETFTASGGSGTGFSWSIVAGNPLPTGLNLSSATGTTTSITAGPPTVAGTYPFAVKLTDSVGNTATTSGLSITINPPISITLSPTQPFAMDQNTSQLVTATVNNDPNNAGVNWSVLTGLGSLSGQTSTTVTYNAPATVSSSSISTFTATSVTDPSKSASFSVSLEPPPVIPTPSFPSGTVGGSYSSAVTANGGVGPYTWSFTALPAGLSLSSSTTNTVNVTGNPTTAGANQTVTIKVTDAKGLTNTLNSTITITAPSCTSNCTISGHVTGPTISGVTIALSNGPTSKPNTTTDPSGFYSFTVLAGGTYTVTPSLPGYTFSPANPSVATSASTTTQNFTEISALPSYSITGTVSYAGTKTGRTYIRVFATNSCNSGCGGAAGTSLASAPSSTGTSYTVRGLLPGTYNVVAEVDTLGNGVPNASNPNGSFGPVTITNADVSVPSFALTATTPAPVAPSGLTIAPGGTFALVMYDQNNSNALRDSNGREIDTSYKVYWGTDVNATNGTPATFAAHGTNDRNYIVRNLTPGTYYFKMSGFVGTTESALSPIVSAVVAAGTGPFTLSGTVSFPGTATGPLYVGLFNGSAIYGKEIMPPFTSPVSYSVPGIAAGNYQAFAIIDQNNNGLIEPSDITNVNNGNGGPPPLTVSGNTTNNITLSSAVSTISITTDHNQFNYVAINDQYNLNLGISWGTKRPVAMTLLSGPNVQVPWDFPVDTNNTEYISLMGTAPLVGDTYQFQVAFSDGSTQTLTGSVTAVLSSFAPSMAMNSPIAGTTTVPVLNWMTPASTPPSPYTYNVGLYNIGGTANVNVQWQDNGGHNGNGIASGTTSIVFNADGSANSNGTSISSLPTATNYQWFVRVQDSNGNTSEETIEYDVP
jgi:hypothetical protein